MISRLHSVSVCVAIACIAVVGHADQKIQSGVTCQARDPDASKVYVDSNGITAEATVDVYCPILRDAAASGFTEVRVGFSGLSDGEVSCALFSKTLNPFLTGSDSITADFNFPINAGIGSINLSDLDEGTENAYVLRCSLTSGERLIGIDYTE